MSKAIPVIINNRDRKTTLQKLVNWLEKVTTPIEIIVIDNASTYPPLLDYYETLQKSHELIRLPENTGPFAPWLSGTVDRLTSDNDYYVVTDSDVVPIDECPLYAIEVFRNILEEYQQFNKVGPSLNIFDLPDHYKAKWDVIRWELRYWKYPANNLMYKAAIDTTFSLYKKGLSVPYYYDDTQDQGDGHCRPEGFVKAVRTGYPYMARHLPWYVNSNNPTSEEIYVREHSNITTHWTSA